MSRIRGKDTEPERAVAEELRARGWEFETHARDRPVGQISFFAIQWLPSLSMGTSGTGAASPYGRTSSLLSGGPRSRLPVAAKPETSVSCGAVDGRSFASGSSK
jgi:hypothetical protein